MALFSFHRRHNRELHDSRRQRGRKLHRPVRGPDGTVAGTIGISLRLNAGGLDVTPSPAPAISAHIDQAAPVIKSAIVTRGANGLRIQVAGYSTAREVTQASFTV